MFSQKRDVNIPVNPGKCLSIEKKVDKVIFNCENNIRVSLKLTSEDIIQVHYSQDDSDSSNKSFAVADSILAKTGSFDFSEQDVSYELYTGKLIVRIDKSPFKIKIYDKWQKLLVEDYKNQGYEIKPSGLAVTKILKDGERIYGLGEKNGTILRNGHKFKMWNSDKPCYSVNADPLYKSIPFFMSSEGYGIFFDNTFKTEFDFGLEKSDAYTFSCPGGEMVYYFIYGPTFKQIINNYTILTGKPIMPPSWAIGFAQSRGLLTNEKLTREIAKGFREREIPCDIIYQDIGWTQYLQDFEWRIENYENPGKMLSDLKQAGFKVIVSQDPVISRANKKQWFEADSLGFFALDSRTGKTYDMPWPWGGNCGVVDFTNPEVADWWGQYQQKVVDTGVKGFWTDMGEPAWSNEESSDRLYMKHYLGMHDEIHNVYGLTWDKVVTEQFEKYNPNQRIFQMTRAAYAGMQKYTFGWSGDAGNGNTVEAGWEQLAAQVPLSLSAGMGLIPFWSCDISGYCGDIKDYEEFSELYIRWMQFGAFNSLSRIHHEGNNAVEPWLFGEEAEKICKSAIEQKYKLFPYIYTYSREAYDTGLPIMRALIIEYPSN
ncbi:MAG: glycoside hydrolase family 31 protein, partial [Bacteroidales bacterium]|nr:glycoside hydrolase family 31 protein [Bacteroidales bacterium]